MKSCFAARKSLSFLHVADKGWTCNPSACADRAALTCFTPASMLQLIACATVWLSLLGEPEGQSVPKASVMRSSRTDNNTVPSRSQHWRQNVVRVTWRISCSLALTSLFPSLWKTCEPLPHTLPLLPFLLKCPLPPLRLSSHASYRSWRRKREIMKSAWPPTLASIDPNRSLMGELQLRQGFSENSSPSVSHLIVKCPVRKKDSKHMSHLIWSVRVKAKQ